MSSGLCQYARGNGGVQYQCPFLKRACPFQHWCTNNRVYELTATAVKCTLKKEKEKENQ